MVSREEEMLKLKARYAQTRGGVVATEKKEVPAKKVTPVKMGMRLPRFDLKPYLNIIEDDMRRLMGLKSREQIVREQPHDVFHEPLLDAWKKSKGLK